ncbi:MAG: hypothetical protein GQ574_01150 [Crocinitomix sp.]|nr:hypothetical protein [Crocinitomix sp.]
MKFGFVLCISFLFFTACNVSAENESQTSLIDSNAFKWDVPTMGYQKMTFNGPLKNVRIKNFSNNTRLRMNTCGIEVPSLSTNRSPENWFFEFDINGLNTSMTIVRDTSILGLSLDSLKFWQKRGGFASSHYISDVKQFESIKNRYPNMQRYPKFLAVHQFAPPLYLPVSYTNESKPFSEKDSALILSRDYYFEQGSIDLYKYEITDKLETRYHSNGLLNRFFYPDTIFDIISHKLIKTGGNKNSSGRVISPSYNSIDSTYDCTNRTRTEYLYNEKGLVVEKINFTESPKDFNGLYRINLDRMVTDPFRDSAAFTKDTYVYDVFNRLDSHYVELGILGGYDKFYYTNSRSVPDSMFSVKPDLEGPTNFFTTIFDSDGNIIEQRFYYGRDKRFLFSVYNMEYDDFDEYNNWQNCKMYMVGYNLNVPDGEPALIFTQQRVYEYYDKN